MSAINTASSQERKDVPLFSGLLQYFPDALCEVARLSKFGNDKHNPGQPLHWAKEKSKDHDDCIMRHLLDAGKRDPQSDNHRHRTMVAWRALAALQTEIDAEEQTWIVAPAAPQVLAEESALQEQGARERRNGPKDRRVANHRILHGKRRGQNRRRDDASYIYLPFSG